MNTLPQQPYRGRAVGKMRLPYPSPLRSASGEHEDTVVLMETSITLFNQSVARH